MKPDPNVTAAAKSADSAVSGTVIDVEARDLRQGDDLFGAGVITSAVWVGGSVQVAAGGTTFTFWPDEEVTVRRG